MKCEIEIAASYVVFIHPLIRVMEYEIAASYVVFIQYIGTGCGVITNNLHNLTGEHLLAKLVYGPKGLLNIRPSDMHQVFTMCCSFERDPFHP